MIDEQLEFRISQYADGSLPAEEIAALEALLASDAEARAMLESYRKLEVAMKRELTLPAVNWDRLAGHFSDALTAAEAQERSTYKIHVSTRTFVSRTWGRLAIAATVLLAIGTAAWLTLRPAHPTNVAMDVPAPTSISPHNPTLVAIAEISGPAAEASNGPAVEEVAIGPSPAAQHTNYAAAEDIIYRTPHVVIASSQLERQDSAWLPFQ